MIAIQIRYNNDIYSATLANEEKAKEWAVDMMGALLDKYGLPEISSVIQVSRIA